MAENTLPGQQLSSLAVKRLSRPGHQKMHAMYITVQHNVYDKRLVVLAEKSAPGLKTSARK